ncbi:MAG: hypothetical protein ACI9U2_002347 [Bradymonadia bacterium]|jgi:hypothetical protein
MPASPDAPDVYIGDDGVIRDATVHPGTDSGADADAQVDEDPDDDLPLFEPAAPTMYRLTRAQYVNSIRDLLGDIEVPADLEADTPLHGFVSVGASELTISPRAVEQYEAAALALMTQVFAPDRRAGFTGCEDPNPECVRAFIATFGRRAWRRPLTMDELDLFAGLYAQLAADLLDRWRALQFTAAGLLQAPDFVFRVEHGEQPDGGGERRYTSYEMAARLSYLLWNSTPDDALLDAADRGDLVTDAGLLAQAERLLADPRARATMRAYFGEYFNLGRLDTLEKDRELYPQMSATLGPAMRGEIERVIDDLIFEQDADLRELMTTSTTFVTAELAALYTLPAVEPSAENEGFVKVELPEDGPRGGLMGMGGILALNAHNTVTSPTHRGKFIQNNLLCVDIPPPPPGVVTSLEEIPDDGPTTTRAKLARHAEDPACVGCHRLMDPLGLALENFDAIGAWRTTENGFPIDASAEIGGMTFQGARELGELLRHQDSIGECLSRRLFRHASGRLEEPGQERTIIELSRDFADDGHRFKALLITLVQSEGFRRVGAVQ